MPSGSPPAALAAWPSHEIQDVDHDDLFASHRDHPPAAHRVRLRHRRARRALGHAKRLQPHPGGRRRLQRARGWTCWLCRAASPCSARSSPSRTSPTWRAARRCRGRQARSRRRLRRRQRHGSRQARGGAARQRPDASRGVGPEKVAGRRVALVQVPTTSGTGSEAGTRALVTDPATQNKLAVQSRHMLADLAVIDPDLTLTRAAARSPPPPASMLWRIASRPLPAARRTRPSTFTRSRAPAGRPLSRPRRADGSDREARAGLALASFYGGFCLGPGQHHGRPCRRLSARHAPPCRAWRSPAR